MQKDDGIEPPAKRSRLRDGRATRNAEDLRQLFEDFLHDTKDFKEELEAAEARKPSGVIKLNVGGKRYITDAADIHRHEGSMLAAMFSGRTQPGAIVDGDSVFINRDGVLFRHVLNYLREGDTWEVPSDVDTKALAREASYFNLPNMLAKLQGASISVAILSNMRRVPDSNMFLLQTPEQVGYMVVTPPNKRAFTLTLKMHFTDTLVVLGICNTCTLDFSAMSVWAWTNDGKTCRLRGTGSTEWSFLAQQLLTAEKEVKLRFRSAPEPSLLYSADGSSEFDVSGAFAQSTGDALPGDCDMQVFILVDPRTISPITIAECGED